MENLTLLFLCTHNRCRSILAEAIATRRGGGCLRAYSAGSAPAGEVHPDTLAALQARGYPVAGLHSKAWDAGLGCEPDAVITLCDSAAGETCPLWLQDTPRLHWGLEDPSRAQPGAARDAAFARVIDTLESRILRLVDAGIYRQRGDALRSAMQALAGE
ncbi:arsenate reductase ArsC [Mangrovimicrobium sediminis]|uniref:Arsenate reductase ArsC n=1 Tax=Mangrovimicrobium sediminis TaxID=2562682 RepID=A0A4Z0M6Z9_9GAMM|nr:arsenate reductase ArsC [Haliea sp. SAOS-164]TGD75188.1 arsenate reductase ArsC [Haliea sp. SAOS-164]